MDVGGREVIDDSVTLGVKHPGFEPPVNYPAPLRRVSSWVHSRFLCAPLAPRKIPYEANFALVIHIATANGRRRIAVNG